MCHGEGPLAIKQEIALKLTRTKQQHGPSSASWRGCRPEAGKVEFAKQQWLARH